MQLNLVVFRVQLLKLNPGKVVSYSSTMLKYTYYNAVRFDSEFNHRFENLRGIEGSCVFCFFVRGEEH